MNQRKEWVQENSTSLSIHFQNFLQTLKKQHWMQYVETEGDTIWLQDILNLHIYRQTDKIYKKNKLQYKLRGYPFHRKISKSPNMPLCKTETVRQDKSSNSTLFTAVPWWILAWSHFPIWTRTCDQDQKGWQVCETAVVSNNVRYIR